MGYLEWGKNNHAFIFTMEADVFLNAVHHPVTLLHPFILIPLLGQIIILYACIQKTPNKILNIIGVAGLSVLIFGLFFIGVIALNVKVICSTIPFVITSIFAVRYILKQV